MAFPYHDRFWVETAEFVLANARPGERILAPDLFWPVFDRIYRYKNTTLRPEARYDWAILHKGKLDRLTPAFLRSVPRELAPVLANEVFVVWAAERDRPCIGDVNHLRAYFEAASVVRETVVPSDVPTDPVLPDQGVIEKLEALGDEDFRRSMDEFWRSGGYLYETVRDKVYTLELDDLVAELLGPCPRENVLDLCCGSGRPGIRTDARSVVGVDISEDAIRRARCQFAGRTEYTFRVMDAHALDFPDGAFDSVMFVDALEHVRDMARVISECARVTRPGGRLVFTGANADSFHLRMTRKLGFPTFKTNNQHFTELNYDQCVALLCRHGYSVIRSEGVFLYPYWGIPGIDEKVRHLTDEDPEIVETLRLFGRRVGPEHAYAYVIAAEKMDDVTTGRAPGAPA